MYFVNLCRNKTVGAFIGLAVFALSIATLIVYLVYATSTDGLIMPWVVVFLALAIIGEGVLFFFDNDYMPVAIAMLPVAALGLFALSPPATIGSVVDKLQGIVMFGDPTKFGIIVVIAVLLLVTSVAAVTACFFARVRKAPVVKDNGVA